MLEQPVNVLAGRLETEAVPHRPLIVNVVVAWQHHHLLAGVQAGQLAVNEGDVRVVHAIVVEQVANDEQQVRAFRQGRVHNAGEGAFRATAKAVGAGLGAAAVQVNIRGVDDSERVQHTLLPNCFNFFAGRGVRGNMRRATHPIRPIRDNILNIAQPTDLKP